MGNILFQNQPQSNVNPLFAMAQQVRNLGPSNVVFDKLYQSNPQFRQFADSMKGKTPEQAFRENGLDFNQFSNLKW